MKVRFRRVAWSGLVLVVLLARTLSGAPFFTDTFETGAAAQWTPMSGTWSVCQTATAAGSRLCQSAARPALTVAGDDGWADYTVQATVNLNDDRKGRVGVLGRFQDKDHFYELRLAKDTAGVKRWWIAKTRDSADTTIASGAFAYERGVDYVLKLTLVNTSLGASLSIDGGKTFRKLGAGVDTTYRVGRIGVKTTSTGATFDDVVVSSAGTTPANTRRFGHVVLVALENHSANQVLGSPYMPYFNELASTYGLATDFYANAHPSMPNYFAWTTGRLFFQTTPLPAGTNNIVRALNAAGKSWRAYFDEPQSSGNVFPYLPEVAADSGQLANIVPITPDFVDAVNNNALPHYSMVHPRFADNGHACPGAKPCLTITDNWLRAYIAPYIATPSFTANHDLLVIAWDEGDLRDPTCSSGPTTILLPTAAQKAGAWVCGGHTVFIVIGTDVKRGYVSPTIFHGEALLRLSLEGLGAGTNLPGASSFAPNMNEFFK
jgi:acid phosphatase